MVRCDFVYVFVSVWLCVYVCMNGFVCVCGCVRMYVWMDLCVYIATDKDKADGLLCVGVYVVCVRVKMC